jgi:hypothetical protein
MEASPTQHSKAALPAIKAAAAIDMAVAEENCCQQTSLCCVLLRINGTGSAGRK